MPAGRPISPIDPEKMENLRQAVAEGWSFREIRKTYGIRHSIFKRHFPDYKFEMTPVETGQLSILSQKVFSTVVR